MGNNISLVLLATGTGTSSATNLGTSIQNALGPVLGCLLAFFILFWLSLVIWTFRDIRSRTQDFLSQILATILVLVFNIGGLFIYLILRPRQTLAEIYERQLEEESLLAEMTERQTCSNCHARVESDFQVCPSCGQKLKRACPKCERLLELRWTYCPYCANSVGAAVPPGVSGMPTVQGNTPSSSLSGNPNMQVSGSGGNY
ncbi:MAG TPA: zinc ribbon domain-containing protein [Dictyobacter sp.]|nr:zinc ribbon domain-containing protein [Dictyobacter sp.]